MTNSEMQAQLKNAQDLIEQVRAALAPAASSTGIIKTEAEFDYALNQTSNPTIRLAPEFLYKAPLIVRRPVAIINEGFLLRDRRVAKDEKLPLFTGGITSQVEKFELLGIEVRSNTNDILVLQGMDPIINQVKVMGDPVKGNKRGITANGGNMSIRQCYIDNIKRVGQDTQAIFTSNMLRPGLFITDSFLCAAGQSFMAGGEDPTDESHIPENIYIDKCTLTKNPAWFTENQQIKCAFELKNCKNARLTNSTLEYAGMSDGQQAYLIVLTPRNQGGKAPYTTVSGVLVENCIARHAGACANFLGSDNVNPSGPLKDVIFNNVHFSDIDPAGITKGNGRCFQFARGGENIILQNITIEGQNLHSIGYFTSPFPKGLMMKNMKLPSSKYGWKIDNGGQGLDAVKAAIPDARFELGADSGATI